MDHNAQFPSRRGAEPFGQQAKSSLPDPALAHSSELTSTFNQALALHRDGRLANAEQLYRQILTVQPDHFDSLHLLGCIYQQRGNHADAIRQIDTALRINPNAAAAHCNRAVALHELSRFAEALASCDTAIALKPDFTEAFYNRGIALEGMQRLDEALASYDQAIALKPDHPEAFNNRGIVLRQLKRLDEALASYDQAIALKPDYPEVFYNRGVVLKELHRLDEALASNQQAIALKPGFAEARYAMCMAELPILYMNEAEIVTRRAAYERRLRELCEADRGSADQVRFAKGFGYSQPFYLPYQGYNDRGLQAIYGAFVCRAMAACYPPAAPVPLPKPEEPVRVGIVSGFFRQHSNWKLPIKGWLSQLDRTRFRIFGYHTSARQDAETSAAAAMCDRFVTGPLSIDGWREQILADAPHVLIYPEVGMDRVAAALAAQRLTAVQCNSWGHPETSGFPTLDYYLSSDLMEPPDAQEHYTERLVRLPNLSVYWEPTEAPPASIAQRNFGLRAGATIYWCCQSLFKYLPRFDTVFPRIARGAGDCQFVFIEGEVPHTTALFRQRLDQAFVAQGLSMNDHCVFLPRLDQFEFLAATRQCHVFLDSIGWSGCNSTLESLLYDLPIVTMPGPLMRGRHSTAILRMMDVTETIAETLDDYVLIAVRLAQDAAWRLAVSARIAAARHRVQHDRACILGLEQFLNHVARGNEPDIVVGAVNASPGQK